VSEYNIWARILSSRDIIPRRMSEKWNWKNCGSILGPSLHPPHDFCRFAVN